MLVLEEWDLEKEFENAWKKLKLSTSSIKLHWRQQLSYFWSYRYLAILSNFKSDVKLVAFSLPISKLLLWLGKYFNDVSKIENCDAP